MAAFQFFSSDGATELALHYASDGVRAGFPSPAQDYLSDTIDLNRELIHHPASTFYARVVGDSMEGEGIEEGDLLVVDKSLEPEQGDLAVCCLNGEFTLKRLRFLPDGSLELVPSNRSYRPIRIDQEMDFSVWGVVTYTIRANRRRRGGWGVW